MKRLIGSPHWQEFGKALLIGFIPGIVLPVAFSFLFSEFTTATSRDILPPLDNPLEIIGCFGALILAAPGILGFILIASIANSLHEHGITIPFFDALPQEMQGVIILVVCSLGNLLFWTLVVSVIRYGKRGFSAPLTVSQRLPPEQG